MRKQTNTNLKAVPGPSEQFSDDCLKRFADELANAICQNEETMDMLLVVADQLMEHCHDEGYISDIGLSLAQHVYPLTNEAERAVTVRAQMFRQKFLASVKGGQA